MQAALPTPQAARRRALAVPALVLSLAAPGCGDGGSAASGGAADATSPVAEARASLLGADLAYADSSRGGTLVDGILRMLADDAILVAGADPPEPGLDAARRALSANPEMANAVMTWTPVRADVSADGTHGYTYGYIDVTLRDGGSAPGKYSAYWRREADGRWKVIAYRRGRRPEGDVAYDAPPGFGTPAAERYPVYAVADRAALRDSVAATDRAFSDMAQERGPGEAFAEYVAPDGANFGQQPAFAFGRDAALALFADFPANRSFSWEPDITVVAPSGDLAFTTGRVDSRERRPDGTETAGPPGRYFSIWRRQPDGSWRFVIDG